MARPAARSQALGSTQARFGMRQNGHTWVHKRTLSDVADFDPRLLRALGFGNNAFVSVDYKGPAPAH